MGGWMTTTNFLLLGEGSVISTAPFYTRLLGFELPQLKPTGTGYVYGFLGPTPAP